MPFVEDFTPFLSEREFADEVLYAPAGGGSPIAVRAILDLEYQTDLEGLVGGSGPALHCAVADAPGAKRGDSVTVRGVAYEVVEPMPDGTGWQTLRLRKA
ncbi:hypothetical protein [Variovorax sp. V15]|uniref:head-tail joining protein n=1 Tax=Variovorax sp. V15 TaxID=3065952 RepID=UPI0034E8CE26